MRDFNNSPLGLGWEANWQALEREHSWLSEVKSPKIHKEAGHLHLL